MQTRKLGPFRVNPIGLGCMNLSHAYGVPPSTEEGERVLLAALDAGVTLFDTATLYGFGANETLVGRVMKRHRSRLTLASKCGMQGVDVAGDGKLVRVIDGRRRRSRGRANLALAREADCSPAQLALAWLLHKAPHIIPIPGTTSVAHLKDNLGASDVKLSADLIARVDAHINQRTVAGARYNAQSSTEVDTEVFA